MKLVYFSPVAWESYSQRPHYMIEFFLRSGVSQVAWVNPYPTRLPEPTDILRPIKKSNNTWLNSTNITIFNIPALPIEPLPSGLWFNAMLLWKKSLHRLLDFVGQDQFILGIGRPSGFCKLFLNRGLSTFSFYDAMDDFPEFYNGISKQYLMSLEREIATHVDRVYASSTTLVRKFERMGIKATLVRNGYEISLLPDSRPTPPIHPTIGYIGTISKWFDWNMIHLLAKALPEIAIILVGPIYNRPFYNLPGNIQLIGECSKTEVAKHLKSFSVGIIPFKKNRLTEAVDPIKYYEYRSMGLPVLSTAFGEMASRDENDGVFFLDKSISLKMVFSRALSYTPKWADVIQFRKENTWETRFSKFNINTT